jgi:hypothetical protein
MKPQGVLLFHTTSAALRSEKLLAAAGIAVKLIPTPRQFSSDCGVALRFEWERREEAEQAVRSAGVETAGMHFLA